ncbi:MAG: RNA polymerase sigma factor [Lentisphaerae bacterium]|nr:RNA polymerase sigma factor [Lentisphaerota bacterium]MBT4815061.1 RNA polymerase sigma factor [Lentisphaerota bacterium]MBT5608748.1 RNA polymerase sigma factor [Lentisphaerota bacterium]MBT7054091.1 RNA polymerase sigma factor [Lentisphaerota bacterium]MBT7845130.1 RNA polymerase sigma factor [Lentisphaerota bacterium]
MSSDLDIARERELIRRIQAGDDTAFDEIAENTKRAAYAVAFRWTRDQHLAFDTVQEAYIKLYGAIPSWRRSSRIQTWLYRVVTNACIDLHRKRRREVTVSSGTSHAGEWHECLLDSEPSASEKVELSDTLAALQGCLESLPTRMRQAIHLRYLCGLSLREVSDVQDCSIGTIKATLFQALRRLRTQMIKLEECPS